MISRLRNRYGLWVEGLRRQCSCEKSRQACLRGVKDLGIMFLGLCLNVQSDRGGFVHLWG